MVSDNNNNGLDNFNEESNPLYQLLKKQATEFELFGQRLKKEIQDSYKEFIKQQEQQEQQNLTQTNDETSITDYKRTQQIIEEITKLSDSQTELIESLKNRVEELETESIIKNQDIKKLRQDLELNKLRIKKFDTKGKSVDIGENHNLKDHEEIWNYEGLNWDDNVNENLLINSKLTNTEPSSSSNSSQINSQIHSSVQKIIYRRESCGKKVKKKNFKILTKDFRINDLIQYTKSESYNTLKDNIRGHIRRLINEITRNENENFLSAPKTTYVQPTNSTFLVSPLSPVLEKLHSQIQQIVMQREILNNRVRLKHLKILKGHFTTKNLIQYTRTGQFSSLDSNTKRLFNLLIYETLSKDFDQQNENIMLSHSLDEYIERGVIPKLPSGYKNYTEFESSERFDRLNKILKARVTKLVKLERGIII